MGRVLPRDDGSAARRGPRGVFAQQARDVAQRAAAEAGVAGPVPAAHEGRRGAQLRVFAGVVREAHARDIDVVHETQGVLGADDGRDVAAGGFAGNSGAKNSSA